MGTDNSPNQQARAAWISGLRRILRVIPPTERQLAIEAALADLQNNDRRQELLRELVHVTARELAEFVFADVA
jgi:hypothetical protein